MAGRKKKPSTLFVKENAAETNSVDLLKDPAFRESVTAYSIRYHRSETRGPHFDFALGNPGGKACIDFVTQRKPTEQQIKTMTPNLPAAGVKQVIAFMEPHDVSFLTSPVRKVHVIPHGEYGAGKWMVIAKGKATVAKNGNTFVIWMGDDSYAVREVTFTKGKKPIKSWLIQLMKNNSNELVRLPISPSKIADASFGHDHVTLYVAADHVTMDLYPGDSHEFRPGLGDHAMIAVNRMGNDVHEVFSYRDLTVAEKRVVENICAEFGGHTRYVNLDKRIFFSSPRKKANAAKSRSKPAASAFDKKYLAAVKTKQAKLMRVILTGKVLAEIEKVASDAGVEVSGGLDFEKNVEGVEGYKKVKGSHWSSPFFKKKDYEAQFHTHVAFKKDGNDASSHPSPSDMCNVSIMYPGFVVWRNKANKVQWVLLRSTHDKWEDVDAMEALYAEAEDKAGSNVTRGFNAAWRAALNKAGLDFKVVVPGKTTLHVELDAVKEKSKINAAAKKPFIQVKDKRPYAFLIAAKGVNTIIWYEFKRASAKAEIVKSLQGQYKGGIGELYALDAGTNRYYQFEVYQNNVVGGKPTDEVTQVMKFQLGDTDALELPKINHGESIFTFKVEFDTAWEPPSTVMTKDFSIHAMNYTEAKTVLTGKMSNYLSGRGWPTKNWKIRGHQVF